MEKMEIMVKENNGGGLQIEVYKDGYIEAVITGIEHNGKASLLADVVGLLEDDWSYTDASQWYDSEGNSMGDRHEDEDRELTASDVVDDDDTTHTIAEASDGRITIYYDCMGAAGRKYSEFRAR